MASADKIAKELRRRYVVANKNGADRYTLEMKSGETVIVRWKHTSARYSGGCYKEGKWWLEVQVGDTMKYFKTFDGLAKAIACGYI